MISNSCHGMAGQYQSRRRRRFYDQSREYAERLAVKCVSLCSSRERTFSPNRRESSTHVTILWHSHSVTSLAYFEKAQRLEPNLPSAAIIPSRMRSDFMLDCGGGGPPLSLPPSLPPSPPPFLEPMKPSINPPIRAAEATLAPFGPIHGPLSLRELMAACAPAVKAVRALAWMSGFVHHPAFLAAPSAPVAAGMELRRA